MAASRRRTVEARNPMPVLRAYQLEVARAIWAAVRAQDGRTLSVQIARQGGKNELSAQLELLLLLTPGTGDLIKVAPSLRPQGLISLSRLWSRLKQAGLGRVARRDGNAVALGENRLLVLSAGPSANVTGHTAGALMEIDEAQDVDSERFSRDFRPMGASRATPAVFYGTPWTESSLLEEMKQRHLDLQRADGVRRHFEYDWQVVAAANPAYGGFALAERERLGEQHPAWRTQYCLETVAGAGMLFTPQQRALLQGTHRRFHMRTREMSAREMSTREMSTRDLETGAIVAGLDVAGEAMLPGREPDETVLTLLWVRPERGEVGAGLPVLEVVEHLTWRGAAHDALLAELTPLIARTWQPEVLAIDSTGLGEGIAAGLLARLTAARVRTQVLRYRISEQVKSRLGFGLLAAAGGRLRCYAQDGSSEYREFWTQVTNARASYKPSRLMSFGVDPVRGHDDYLMSLALAVEAAGLVQPRVARGRRGAEIEE